MLFFGGFNIYIGPFSEYIYAGKSVRPHIRVYGMGVAGHGALGFKHFLRPLKGRKVMDYVHRPFRIPFVDENKVKNVKVSIDI